MKNFSETILRLLGWKVSSFSPREPKYILIVAPHTSWMDFVIGKLAFNTKDIPAVFFIKKEFFIFPLRKLLLKLGGIPIDRENAGNIIEHTAAVLEKKERMAVIITPEGTRKKNPHWKKGFYFLARRTGLKVYTGIVDYSKKTCAILPEPLDTDKDFGLVIQDLARIYKGAKGRYPENFNF